MREVDAGGRSQRFFFSPPPQPPYSPPRAPIPNPPSQAFSNDDVSVSVRRVYHEDLLVIVFDVASRGASEVYNLSVALNAPAGSFSAAYHGHPGAAVTDDGSVVFDKLEFNSTVSVRPFVWGGCFFFFFFFFFFFPSVSHATIFALSVAQTGHWGAGPGAAGAEFDDAGAPLLPDRRRPDALPQHPGPALVYTCARVCVVWSGVAYVHCPVRRGPPPPSSTFNAHTHTHTHTHIPYGLAVTNRLSPSRLGSSH